MQKRKAEHGLLLICLFIISFAYGQSTPKEKKMSEAELDQMEKAQLMLDEKNYRLALPVFEDLLAKHPNEPRLKYFTAICYFSRPDKHPQMLQYLTEVYEINKKADHIEFDLAKAYHMNYKFDEAGNFLNQYISKKKNLKDKDKKEVEELTRYIENAKKLVAAPISVKIKNLGPNVNTSASENSPYVTLNDSLLIFTYRGERSTGGMQNAFNETVQRGLYYEDAFYSVKENDVWSKPKGILNVNSNNNDEALSISYDGQKLFTSRDSEADDGDIYMSTLTNGEWTIAMKVTGDVNSPHWEDNCSLSPDGKTLFFSSNRPGGMGGKDIYKSNLQADGSWGPAQNLGDKINTAEDEDDPFFHLDGKLLLFSSKGHNSMGGYDIFKTYLNADSTWTNPENMGYPINTPDDDVHYVLSPAGDKGYCAISKADGFGDYDLYTVEPGIIGVMPALVVVQGSIKENDKPVQADVLVTVNGVLKKYRSNPTSGVYQVVMPVGQDYTLTYKLNDTVSQSQAIETAKENAYVLKVHDINFKTKRDSVVTSSTATTIATSAAEEGEIIEELSFKIQIAAGGLHWGMDKKKVAEYGSIERKVVDNLSRYTLSTEYKTLKEAKKILMEIRAGIVNDAFIICTYKNKRCYVSDLRKAGVIK